MLGRLSAHAPKLRLSVDMLGYSPGHCYADGGLQAAISRYLVAAVTFRRRA